MTTVNLSDGRELIIRDKVLEGDISEIFDGTLFNPDPVVEHKKVRTRYERIMDREAEQDTKPVMVKIAKQAYNNDLIERDVIVLGQLHPEKIASTSSFHRYYPTSYGGALVDGKQAHIMEEIKDCVTLATVLKAYPNGIDYRDVAWMLKRALVGLWYAHRQGVIHGAILPPHVLLTLGDHGGRLIDWSYSTDVRVKVPAMLNAYEDYYPPEVPSSEPAREGTDLYMLVKCAQALLGGDLKTKEFPDSVPGPIKDLFLLCLNDSVHMRPIDASDVHDTFDKLLKDAVGKPKFRPFTLPIAI
jgi:hypothetical protein